MQYLNAQVNLSYVLTLKCCDSPRLFASVIEIWGDAIKMIFGFLREDIDCNDFTVKS